jgi:hypothetical protein
MADPTPRRRRWWVLTLIGIVLVLGVATGVFWDDLKRTALDPKTPFQTYHPPPAPDYARRNSWALFPTDPDAKRPDLAADVFFVAPTTFNGGDDWNAPVRGGKIDRFYRQVMAPNYVGPFVRVGRIFAPRYRQASLYSMLTLREDAREARKFAYADIASAFHTFIDRYNHGRPVIIVGVEQGGTLAERLVAQEVASNPELRARLAVAYLQDTITPADDAPLPPCRSRSEAGCLASWARVYDDQFERAQMLLDRSLVWDAHGDLVNLGRRPALCFNPLLGATSDANAPARLNLGAANATGLEWDARPAFMARQVSAQCRGGVLHVTRPKSASLRREGSWADRRKVPGYNLFYADLEADARARLTVLASQRPAGLAPPSSRTAPAAPAAPSPAPK